MNEPKIRLKGFSGEWENSIIGDIATFSKGRGYSKSDLRPVGNPIVLYGRLYTNYSSVIESVDTFATLQNGSVLSKGNEVIIPGSGETPEDIAVAAAVEQKCVILGGDLNVVTFDQDKIVPAFAAMSISNSKTHYELSGYAQGKTVVHLHNSSISKGHISYPSIDEQKAIVSYVSSIDSLIQSTTKKIESLKQVKAASLQSMFPQEGETTPRVRFKGFEGEWNCIEFGSIITECLDKTTIEDEDILLSSAIDGVYLNSELFGHFRGKSNIGYRKLKKNMLILSAQNLHLGNANVNLRFEHGIVSPAYKIYYIHDCNPELLSHWIKREETKKFFLDATTAGASACRKNIVWEDLYKQTLYLPKDELEQQKLASYLTSLTNQITLQTQRLEKLKQIKSACLDNMFV